MGAAGKVHRSFAALRMTSPLLPVNLRDATLMWLAMEETRRLRRNEMPGPQG